MIADDAAQWHDLFAAGAESSATLVGLLFVAVSLNHKRILDEPRLPAVAARALGVLLGLLLMSTLILTPGQTATTLGAEVTVLGGILVGAVAASTARTHLPVTHWHWTAATVALSALSTVPMLVAGVTLLAGSGGGLYWALGELVLGITVSVYYAWILLVEILR